MKKLVAFLLLCCLLLSFAACSQPKEEPVVEDEEPIEEPLQVTTLLTSAEVQQATGIEVGEPQQHTDGSAGYFSADQTQIVYLAVQEMTASAFDEMLTALSADFEVTDAPNLGEKAVWCESQLNLYIYAEGWAVEVHVEYTPENADDSLLASRQLAVLLMEKL